MSNSFVNDCTQEQNSSPYFSSIVRAQLAVSVKKGRWNFATMLTWLNTFSIEALIPETADGITGRLHEKHISGQANPFLVSG